MAATGTPLETKVAASPELRPRVTLLPFLGMRKPEMGQYKLETDCANLQTEADGVMSCAAYTSPERPSICEDFKIGSLACRMARVQAGVDDLESFREYVGSA